MVCAFLPHCLTPPFTTRAEKAHSPSGRITAHETANAIRCAPTNSENKKEKIMVIAVAAIGNIFPTYAAIKDGRELIEAGRLGIRCVNIICMVFIIAIIIAFAIKDICDKKLKDSDEE